MGVNTLNRYSKYDMNLGKMEGAIPVGLYAQKEDVNTTEKTMWPSLTQDRYVIKSVAGTTTTIVSTDAEDTMTTGTGIWTVQVGGILADYTSAVEVVELNGTTPVNLVNEFIAVNFMNPELAGSLKTAVGVIKVLSDTDILGLIDYSDVHAHNIMTQATFTTPIATDYKVTKITAESGTTDQITVRVYVVNPINGVHILQDSLLTTSGAAVVHDLEDFIDVPEKHTIEVTATASLGVNRSCTVNIQGILFINKYVDKIANKEL